MEALVQALPVIDATGSQVMQTPEDVAQMLRLRAAGLGIKSIALEMAVHFGDGTRYGVDQGASRGSTRGASGALREAEALDR
jgi:hypothetical protein